MQLVQNTLSRFVSSGQIAGCSARIMRNDEVCFEGCFGYADIENKVKISDSTIATIKRANKPNLNFIYRIIWTPYNPTIFKH